MWTRDTVKWAASFWNLEHLAGRKLLSAAQLLPWTAFHFFCKPSIRFAGQNGAFAHVHYQYHQDTGGTRDYRWLQWKRCSIYTDICGTWISFGLVGSDLLIGQREALVGQEGDGLSHSLPSGAAGFTTLTTHGSKEDKGNQREINMKSARHQLETYWNIFFSSRGKSTAKRWNGKVQFRMAALQERLYPAEDIQTIGE